MWCRSLTETRTSGAPFTSSPLPLVIPPNSVQTARVTGIASRPGLLQLRGVSLRLFEGSTTDVLLPVINEKGRRQRDKRRSQVASESSKVKRFGLEARFPQPIEPSYENPESWLECMVVEEQPLLWIRKTSLTHGTVMLYNGETLVDPASGRLG